MSDDMGRNARMGLDVRWYGTECPNGIGCPMVWDGMLCTKGLERMECPMVWDGMPCAKGLIARVKGLDALCEGI